MTNDTTLQGRYRFFRFEEVIGIDTQARNVFAGQLHKTMLRLKGKVSVSWAVAPRCRHASLFALLFYGIIEMGDYILDQV